MLKINNFSLFLFTLGLGLRFSGGTLPFVSPILIVSVSVAIEFLKSGNRVGGNVQSNLKAFLPSIIFLIYILVSVLWSMSPAYGTTKVGLLAFWVVCFSIMCNNITSNFNLFCKYILINLVLILVLFYMAFGSPVDLVKNISTFYRLSDDETSPISYSRFLGLGILASFMMYTKYKRAIHKTLILLIVAIAFSYMVLSGSKGPIFSLLLSLSFLYIYRNTFRNKVIASALIAVFACGAFFYFTLSNSFLDFLNQRFLTAGNSYNLREGRYAAVQNDITFNDPMQLVRILVGTGSGNFSYLFDKRDAVSYPHNILLEVIYEYGIIGMALFFGAVLSPFLKCLLKRQPVKEAVPKYLMGFWIYMFANSMVSGDISSNFLLFGFSILLAAFYLKAKTSNVQLSKV